MSVPDLDAALALHGLAVADVPGIRDAWASAFAVLDGPPIETVEQVAEEILGELNVARPYTGLTLSWAPQIPECNDDLHDGPEDGLRPVLVLSTRQGGGNRDHDDDHEPGFVAGCSACSNEAVASHPRFLCDFDDDFDRTYAWHVFTIPGEARARLLTAHTNTRAAMRQHAATRLAELILNGTVTPWSLLESKAEAVSLEREASRNRPGGEYIVKRNADEVARLTRHLAVLDGLTPATPRDSTESTLAEMGVKGRKEETDRVMVVRAREATLDEPDLAAWLFAVTPAGMGSYVVGTGRQKQVKRYEKFDRGPLATLEDHLSRSTYGARLAERREQMVAELDAATARVADEGRKTQWTSQTLPVLRWQLGWPGEPDRCPAYVAPPVAEASSFEEMFDA